MSVSFTNLRQECIDQRRLANAWLARNEQDLPNLLDLATRLQPLVQRRQFRVASDDRPGRTFTGWRRSPLGEVEDLATHQGRLWRGARGVVNRSTLSQPSSGCTT